MNYFPKDSQWSICSVQPRALHLLAFFLQSKKKSLHNLVMPYQSITLFVERSWRTDMKCHKQDTVQAND